ncbi:MAG: twin-arginine translocase TatA/TatE family subunit [Nitrospirales bacterium]
MFGSLGFTELILILVIVMIIFGAGKLPQLGEGIGKAIKGFKKSVQEANAIEAEAQTVAQQAQPAPAAHPTEGGQVPSPGQATTPQAVAPSPDQVAQSTVQTTQPEPVPSSKG